MKNLTTLCYIEKDEKYLMLHRISKSGDINKGKWIGVGGHFEEGESPEECLAREVKEETGFTLSGFSFRGIVTFSSNVCETEYMMLFTGSLSEGEGDILPDCNEGILKWIDKKDVLSLNLWEGDKIFLKLLNEDRDFFSLKLVYENDDLIQAVLDGKNIL